MADEFVGYTFGNNSKMMNRWAELTGDAMGRATSQLKQGALAMGALFRQAAPTEEAAARLSQRFAVLALDAESFFGAANYDEAIGKIRAGLTGEAEPLRDYGVFLTEAAVKAKALELGMIKVGEELTEQGKIMARAILIQEGLAVANGDVERTAGDFANRVRALRAEILELSQEVGNTFLPLAERLVGWLKAAVSTIKDLPPNLKDAAIDFGIFAAAIGPVIVGFTTLATAVLPLFLANMGPVFVAISALMNPLGTALVLLGKLAGEFGLVSRALGLLASGAARFLGPWGLVISAILLFSDSIGSALRGVGAMIREELGPKAEALLDRLASLFADLDQAFQDIAASPIGDFFKMVTDIVGVLIEVLLRLVGSGIIAGIGALIDMVTGIAEYVQGVVQTVSKLLQGDWEGAWQAAGNTVARAVQRIANLIRGVMPWLAGALDLMARLTGDPTQLNSGQKSGGIGGAISFVQTVAGRASESMPVGLAAGSYAIPGSGDSKAKGARGRSGPSAEELADRREEIKLEQALAVAQEKGDIEGERALRRQLDLKSKIDQYERAGLDKAAAKLAAEKDLTELDQARAEAMAREIADEEAAIDLQLAELRNDYEAVRFLKDQEYIRKQILMWRGKDVSLAEAELRAANDLKNLEEARAEQMSRRLRADILAADGPGGFLDGPHLPKILFEAHIFDRETGGRFRASHPNISSRTWNRKLYVGGQGEWLRLYQAMQLDRRAALRSASVGGAQIMGFNHQLAGFDTVEAFWDAMKTSERAHLAAFVSFIRNRGLVSALRAISNRPADCIAFAKGYNGSGFAANEYHIKIAGAHAKWSAA
ncbi:uncharacterized protein DUF3380 [Blastomonas natatoria]|uniref:Uncharacterized protein DUF3380 n=1 Tax=Blastomonas natatoria TaxID=34015 RepID=A0A2V3UPH4_9SPHN|nr:N-acetylmuramidase domain-containing protein [Blastomonas natatoria]PXW67901.1 uncharacterized protein DUF3380 [Blastomonas natatoria]